MTKVKLDDKSRMALARRTRSAFAEGVVSQDKKLGEQKLGMFSPIRPRMGSEAVEAVSTLSRTSGARGRMASRSFSQNMADGSVQTKGLGQQLREPSESFFSVGNFDRDRVRSPMESVFSASQSTTQMRNPFEYASPKVVEYVRRKEEAKRQRAEDDAMLELEREEEQKRKTEQSTASNSVTPTLFSADRGGVVSNAKRTRSAGRGGTVKMGGVPVSGAPVQYTGYVPERFRTWEPGLRSWAREARTDRIQIPRIAKSIYDAEQERLMELVQRKPELIQPPGSKFRDFFPGVTRAAQVVANTGRAVGASVRESARYLANTRLALPGAVSFGTGGATLAIGTGSTAAALAPAVLAAAAGAGGYEAGRRIYANDIEPWMENRLQERVGKINATGNKVARDYETMVKGREARVAKFKAHPGAAVALQRLREDPSLVDAFVEKFGVNPMYVDSSFRDIGSKVKARRTK